MKIIGCILYDFDGGAVDRAFTSEAGRDAAIVAHLTRMAHDLGVDMGLPSKERAVLDLIDGGSFTDAEELLLDHCEPGSVLFRYFDAEMESD